MAFVPNFLEKNPQILCLWFVVCYKIDFNDIAFLDKIDY